MQNGYPKPIVTATEAIILHTLGVQVIPFQCHAPSSGVDPQPRKGHAGDADKPFPSSTPPERSKKHTASLYNSIT